MYVSPFSPLLAYLKNKQEKDVVSWIHTESVTPIYKSALMLGRFSSSTVISEPYTKTAG